MPAQGRRGALERLGMGGSEHCRALMQRQARPGIARGREITPAHRRREGAGAAGEAAKVSLPSSSLPIPSSGTGSAHRTSASHLRAAPLPAASSVFIDRPPGKTPRGQGEVTSLLHPGPPRLHPSPRALPDPPPRLHRLRLRVPAPSLTRAALSLSFLHLPLKVKLLEQLSSFTCVEEGGEWDSHSFSKLCRFYRGLMRNCFLARGKGGKFPCEHSVPWL